MYPKWPFSTFVNERYAEIQGGNQQANQKCGDQKQAIHRGIQIESIKTFSTLGHILVRGIETF